MSDPEGAGGRRRPRSRLRRTWVRALLAVLVVAMAALVGIGANTLALYRGWTVTRMDPADLSAMLAPHYRIATPDGPGPFPTALLFSGCDGPGDNMERWTGMFLGKGWATIVVDSHSPRGFLDYEIWRLICSGQLFMGSERAGDLLVAIDDARAMAFVDPNRLVLVGMSHGGWSIMELLVLDPPPALPFNLSALPPGVGSTGLAGVVGAILVYPWCGLANRARQTVWRRPVPTLFVLSDADMIAPAWECVEIADALEARGLPVETVMFEGVTHGFDQEIHAPLTTLVFDPAATAEALARAAAFLDRIAGGGRR